MRVRQDILLTEQVGDQRPASQWLHETGRARLLKDMAVTADCYVLPAVVVVHDQRMKDPWCLATNRSDLKAAVIVKLYGKRFHHRGMDHMLEVNLQGSPALPL